MIIELTNGRLLDCVSDSPIENTNIIIEDGLIKDIYKGQSQNKADILKINCGGKTGLGDFF